MRAVPQGAPRAAVARAARRARAHSRSRRGRAAARTARLIGAIVAGGANERFGGEPKGLRTVAGARIIDRVAAALRPSVRELLLVSNAPNAQEWLPDARVVRDRRNERGSLVGLHTALSHAPHGAMVVAWDMPFVSAGLVELVRADVSESDFAVLPEGPNGPEPFCGFYSRACVPIIDAALDAHDLRLGALIDRLPAVRLIARETVARVGDPARLFFNVNSLDELAVAERMA